MYKTAARFIQRERAKRACGQKSYHLTKEDWRQIRTVNPSGVQNQPSRLRITQNEFFQTNINLFYIRQRAHDAFRAARLLNCFGAQVKLIEVEDYLNAPHVGTIYYFKGARGDAHTAAKIAQVVRKMETVVPSTDKLRKRPSKTPYSLWLVSRR